MSSPNRVGLNIGSMNYWDNGQLLKNLIGIQNPGMEPLVSRQIWALNIDGTTTSFTDPDQWDGVPPNYWVGGTFTIVESQSGGAEFGCTGTIASNTGPNVGPAPNYAYALPSGTGVNPTFTTATACAAPFKTGDIVVLTKTTSPTPEEWWEYSGHGGVSGSVSNGGRLYSDITDLCSTCGSQALTMDASASGSTTEGDLYFDSFEDVNIFVLMNGSYQLSFWAKKVAGSPLLTVSASRYSTGGFNCGPYTPSLTTTWTQYTFTCTASETQGSTSPGSASVRFSTTGGSIYLDNVSFQKTGTDPANTTVFRDEVIQTIKNFYGPSIGNNPGTLRYWVNQNGETMSNWTAPDYARMPSGSGTGYFVFPGGANSMALSLEDYLVICQLLQAQPYLEVPVTFSATEAAQLIEFLAGPSSTTYGARRAALGQTNPWTSVFGKIHLSFCNECWNGSSFVGQALDARTSQPNQEYYYDYSTRARDIFAAMRADSYFSAGSFDLVMNAQTAVNYSMDTAIARAHPDSIEIEDYTYGKVLDYSSDAALWGAAMVDPWEKVTNPSDTRNFYQSVHDYQSQMTCGSSGTAKCNVNIYEWGQGTLGGALDNDNVYTGIDQNHLDYINAGAGEGAIMALQPLLNMQYYGIGPQSFFALSEYQNNSVDGLKAKLWGNVVDMGGATNNVRPTFLGVQLVNQSIIGPMYSCPITSNPTYTFAGSQNGYSSMPSMQNVPYLYAFCFENASKRSLVLINTDLTNAYTVSFAGTNTPQGTVTQRQLVPSSLDLMNEAPTGSASNMTPTNVRIETATLSSPSSIALPPFSATALDYTLPNTPVTDTPIFSPASATYSGPQSVTISVSTPGATIYYTTDGSAPTTSSPQYSGAIIVSTSETINAFAAAPGYIASSVGSATYTITVPVAPTGLKATAGTGQVVLSWTASSGASSYNVYEGTASGGEGATPIASGIASTSYTVSSLTSGITYYFKLAAVNSIGTSPQSSEVYATPLSSGGGSVLLAYEPFGESTGALHGASGSGDFGWDAGTGWEVQNSDTAAPGYNVASTTQMTYPGLAISGNYAVGGHNYVSSGRQLDVSASGPFASYLDSNRMIGAPGTTIWLSFLMREDTADRSAWLSLSPQGGGVAWWANPVTIGVGASGGKWSLVYGASGNSLSYIPSNVAVTQGQTTLIVLQVAFGSTNVVNMYVNPTSMGGSAPMTANATYSTTDSLAFQSLVYFGGSSANQSSIDEIRVGSSYASVTPSSGKLLAYEPFGESTGALHGTSGNGDSGWAAGSSWQVQNGDTAVPGYNVASTVQMTYPGLAISGNYAVGGHNYVTSGRQLDASATGPFASYLDSNGMIGASGSTVWISFLMREDTADRSAWLSLSQEGGGFVWWANPFNIGVGISGGKWSLVYGAPGDSPSYTPSNVTVTQGQTALIVLKVTFGSTNVVNMYVNPASLGGSAPTTANATYSTTNSLAFQSLVYFAGPVPNQSSIDEIRIGSSYASVTP